MTVSNAEHSSPQANGFLDPREDAVLQVQDFLRCAKCTLNADLFSALRVEVSLEEGGANAAADFRPAGIHELSTAD